MTLPPTVLDLIRRFDDNAAEYRGEAPQYRSPAYNETETRREFIDPLFNALGWDVDNTQGYSEKYKEIVHEARVTVGGRVKAPDYAFRVGGRPVFFVEAKRPGVALHAGREADEAAFQVRRYAWSAKLPVSVLTNFAEFALYDCRSKPARTDGAGVARVLYVTGSDYPTRWDELAELLSPEAIRKGALDRFVESAKAARGTLAVDAAFLAEIETWRDALARTFALRNAGLTVRQLNFAVQKTIDRIIFLRIAEDRGFEPYHRLGDLAQGKDVYRALGEVFRQADNRYNAGLFYFRPEAGREADFDDFTLDFQLDDKVLKDILTGLYYPDSPYAFDALPADILGQVYEQFLGKVIRLTAGGRAKVEEKPEVKKAGGVYYTPTYIVDYIVEHTVGPLLAGKTWREARGLDARGVQRYAPLRLLDPACGSGTFLLQAYQYLLDWYLEQYTAEDTTAYARAGRIANPVSPPLSPPPGGTKGENLPPIGGDRGGEGWRLTTEERKAILLTHIYGVDIDPQAVEVTKLSLLLKVLEGEDEQSLGQQLTMSLGNQERVLPDLGQNIRCGNSLIGSDFYEGQQLGLGLLDEEEVYRINAFDWDAPEGFGKVMAAGGFDAVIGNPPYGALLYADEEAYLRSKYRYQDYQLDTYLIFVEKGLALLKSAGRLGVIIPNTWLLNLKSPRIREYIFAHTQIQYIAHYLYKVFPKVTVDTEIVVVKKAPITSDAQIHVEIVGKDRNTRSYSIPQIRWKTQDSDPVNIFEEPRYFALADRMRALPLLDTVCIITQGTKPFQVGKGRPPQTREIVRDKPFVAEVKRDDTFRPLLRGSLMQRYRILWKNDYWISFGDWLAEPRYSANHDAASKIVIRQTGDSLVATLDREQFVVRDNLYTIVLRIEDIDLCYVLGLVSSKLLNWFYQKILNPEQGEALAQVKRGHLAKLPIRPIDFADPADVARHDRMVALVERMLELHRRLAAAKLAHEKHLLQQQIDVTDKAIDALVYALYDLTPEEIEIVEGA